MKYEADMSKGYKWDAVNGIITILNSAGYTCIRIPRSGLLRVTTTTIRVGAIGLTGVDDNLKRSLTDWWTYGKQGVKK